MKKRNNKGFTLVELLAIILILAIIASVTIFASIKAIKSARSKSYMITKTSISNNASNYVIENENNFFARVTNDSNHEYACVTVQKLIDMGYLSNNVTESPIDDNRNVLKDDYIYIERDYVTKAISKTEYIDDSSKYSENCKRVTGNIVFSANPSLDTWSKTKDITITYNTNNYDKVNMSNFRYQHVYFGNTITNTSKTHKITNVNRKATIKASIMNGSNVLTEGELTVGKIDGYGPRVTIIKDNVVREFGNIVIPIRVIDRDNSGNDCDNSLTCSLVNYNTFNINDIKIAISGVNINSSNMKLVHNGNGNYDILINDNDISANSLRFSVASGQILDNVGNGNDSISETITIPSKCLITINATNGIIGSDASNKGWTVKTNNSAYRYIQLNQPIQLPSVTVATGTKFEFKGWKIGSMSISSPYIPTACDLTINADIQYKGHVGGTFNLAAICRALGKQALDNPDGFKVTYGESGANGLPAKCISTGDLGIDNKTEQQKMVDALADGIGAERNDKNKYAVDGTEVRCGYNCGEQYSWER